MRPISSSNKVSPVKRNGGLYKQTDPGVWPGVGIREKNFLVRVRSGGMDGGSLRAVFEVK